MDTTLIMLFLVVAVAILVAAGIAAIVLQDDRRRRELREGFRPEYHRALARTGDRRLARKELESRQKRVASFELRPLHGQDAFRFAGAWLRAQERFVDDPNAAIADADRLVQDVMRARSIPAAAFDQGTNEVSIHHPLVVQNYRRAHQISQASERGEASTEELRQAMVLYRSLFDELLERETSGTAGRR